MKKLILLNALLFGLSSSLACAPSVEDILEKMIEAQGGREALSRILDRDYSATMKMSQTGITGSMRMYQKMPNKMRTEIQMTDAVLVQTYDGVTAWEVNHLTGHTKELPDRVARSFERQALGLELILNPAEWGVEYTYLGEEHIQGKDCHVLKQSFSDGYESTLYVAVESNLLVMGQSTDMGPDHAEVETRTLYSDYREVEGVSIPFRISVFQDGQESMLIVLDDVAFNSELSDSLFVVGR